MRNNHNGNGGKNNYYSRNNRQFDGQNRQNYQEESFMQSYVTNFNKDNLAENLSLDVFGKFKNQFYKIKSNSALRKVFDSYLDIYKNDNNNIKIEIWFARVGYQEKRQYLPDGFLKFINGIYCKLDKDKSKFKDFLEVFVAYHKYFNQKAK